MAFKEIIVRHGKGYKMVFIKELGNYRVYHSGTSYIFSNKRDASRMVDAFRSVAKILNSRRAKNKGIKKPYVRKK